MARKKAESAVAKLERELKGISKEEISKKSLKIMGDILSTIEQMPYSDMNVKDLTATLKVLMEVHDKSARQHDESNKAADALHVFIHRVENTMRENDKLIETTAVDPTRFLPSAKRNVTVVDDDEDDS